MKKIYKLIISLIIPQLAGGLGSYFMDSTSLTTGKCRFGMVRGAGKADRSVCRF